MSYCALLTQYALLLLTTCAIYYLCQFPSAMELQLFVARPASAPAPPQRPSLSPPPPRSASPPPPRPPPPPVPTRSLTPSPFLASSPKPTSVGEEAAAAASATTAPAARLGPWRPASSLPHASGALPPCVEASAWDNSHFSADRDWVPVVDGHKAAPDTLWRFNDDGQGGHLLNKGSNGHINSRPGGFVRGHGNGDRLPRRPAPRADSTFLIRTEVPYAQYAAAGETRACAWAPSYYSLRFRKSNTFLHVEEDGALAAGMTACSDDLACLFSMEAVPEHPGWSVVRSVLTGGLLRMVGDSHPPFDGWNGLHGPKAMPKSRLRREFEQKASEDALSGRARCPLRAAGPPGWTYNASAYSSAIRRWLGPW